MIDQPTHTSFAVTALTATTCGYGCRPTSHNAPYRSVTQHRPETQYQPAEVHEEHDVERRRLHGTIRLWQP